MAVQPFLCLTWSETPKAIFVMTWLISKEFSLSANSIRMFGSFTVSVTLKLITPNCLDMKTFKDFSKHVPSSMDRYTATCICIRKNIKFEKEYMYLPS